MRGPPATPSLAPLPEMPRDQQNDLRQNQREVLDCRFAHASFLVRLGTGGKGCNANATFESVRSSERFTATTCHGHCVRRAIVRFDGER
jgi:hypothetical protein